MEPESALTISSILFLLLEGLAILTAASAVMERRTSQGAIAWAMALVLFPYIALPLYWVFGRTRFHGYIEALRKRQIQHREETEYILESVRRYHCTPVEEYYHDVTDLEQLILVPTTAGNKVELLIDGEATFDAIFEAIESARDYLLIQFFIVKNDRLGKELQERLIRKAEEGVRIFFLFDEIGSHKLRRTGYISRLRKAGVKIVRFNSTRGRRNRFQVNFRNHRKTVVADGRIAFLGGHNVGDEYVGRGIKFSHWRDTHVSIIGPAVLSVQFCFAMDWYWAARTVPKLNWEAQDKSEADQPVLVFPTGPADETDNCTLLLLQLITMARKRLWIASPYFVPDAAILQALKLAAVRGVDVRIMLPDKPDHLLVYLASFSYLAECERVGIKFYRYVRGFLHQKVVLIDDEVASVGTVNLDNRSIRLNFEISAVVMDKQFAAETARMLARDFADCRRATNDDFKKRSLPFKVAVHASRLLEPIL